MCFSGFKLLRVHFWTPCKETVSKKGQKVDLLKIKNGLSWGPVLVPFPFIVANLLRRLFQVEADLTRTAGAGIVNIACPFLPACFF